MNELHDPIRISMADLPRMRTRIWVSLIINNTRLLSLNA